MDLEAEIKLLQQENNQLCTLGKERTEILNTIWNLLFDGSLSPISKLSVIEATLQKHLQAQKQSHHEAV